SPFSAFAPLSSRSSIPLSALVFSYRVPHFKCSPDFTLLSRGRGPAYPMPDTAVISYKEDVTVRLLTTFKRLISEGSLISGSRLPAERELAEKFQVSRPSLRQALKVLETIG